MRNMLSKLRLGISHMSLSMVILLSSLLIVAVVMLFLAGVLMPRVSELLIQNAVKRIQETALQSTRGIELYIDNMISTLHFASSLITEMDDLDDADFGRINLIRDSQSDIINIALFDERGRMIYATSDGAGESPAMIATSDWFAKALQRKSSTPCFVEPRVEMLFKDQYRWVVPLSRSVEYTRGGESGTGVLLIDYNYPAIAQLTEDIRFGPSGYAYLINADDALISHPQLQLIYAGIWNEDLSTVIQQVTGVCQDESQERKRILVINTISKTRWRMVGVAYIDEILLLQNTFVRMFSIALACGGLLSLAMALMTAYYVTLPIRQLEAHMRNVEQGDLQTAIVERGFQELRSLSATFNHMLERIRCLMGQIVAEQEAKRLHELNALQAQINPHFLYNTLDSIIWMEERRRPQEAIEMVSALAKLFRISISKGRRVITVREELEHVRNYLIIQKKRFRNKFEFEIRADEDVLMLNTVKLIVQPLVENAVTHGVYSYDDKVMFIMIEAHREGDKLIIVVKDDGMGIPEQKLERALLPAGNGGIGLRNVHERIQLTCGTEYGLTVESVEEEGTTVTITQPTDLEG